MVHVPEGEFLRGTPGATGEDDERPARKIAMSAFWIDRTEVTAAQYRKCVVERACSPAGTGPSCNFRKDGRDDHPINCVTWSAGDSYCKWAGGSLPSEAQWEKAARGPYGRLFPWGWFFLSCDKAVFNEWARGHACGQNSTWAVGSKPAGTSPYGAVDMSGNVWEWVQDDYDAGFYARSPDRDPILDKKSVFGIMRGGGFGRDQWEGWRAANRFKFAKMNQTEGIGFRCVMPDT